MIGKGFIVDSITPKTNLFLNIIVFVFLFYAWRYLFNLIAGSLKLKTNVAIIGYNPQAIELAKELIKNPITHSPSTTFEKISKQLFVLF